MDKAQLKEIAQAVLPIPSYFVLEMEDDLPKGEERDRCFIWEDPNHEGRQIEVSLDLHTGQLIYLSVDEGDVEESQDGGQLTQEQCKEIANLFVERHHSNYPSFAWVQVEKLKEYTRLSYKRAVHSLPVPHTGCEVTLNARGEIITYRTKERTHEELRMPVWPQSIVESEIIKQIILREMKVDLVWALLSPAIYDLPEGMEGGYRLVYQPILEHRLVDSVTGEDLFEPSHYIMPDSHPIQSIPSPQAPEPVPCDWSDVSMWAMKLGLDLNRLRLERTDEDGEAVRYIFRREPVQEIAEEPDPLSVDGYMERNFGNPFVKLNQSIVLEIEKSTGRLLGFRRFITEDDEGPTLSREECFNRAQFFLGQVFPDYAEYLRLYEQEDDADRDRQFFHLRICINGIPLYLESVKVTVNAHTGEISLYHGVSYVMLQQIIRLESTPRITQEGACNLLSPYLQLQLRWYNYQGEDGDPNYRLIYESSVLRQPQSEALSEPVRLRFIDAMSGKVIWNKR